MRKLKKTKTSVCEVGFLVFPSYLLNYSTYLDEILNWGLAIGSPMITGIAA
jgi:hypothetical protein